MPQIILEKSANIKSLSEIKEVFKNIHQVLHELGKINLENCKSRARIASDYLVGDGNLEEAFVHLEIRFLEGRSDELKARLGGEILAILEHNFLIAGNPSKLQITVEISDIIKSSYFKFPAGAFSKQ